MLLVAGGPNLRTACNIAQECGIHMVPHTNTLIKVFSEPGKYIVADYIRYLQGLDARHGDELLLVLSNPVTEYEVELEERALERGMKVQLINGPADRRRQQALRTKYSDMQAAASFFKQAAEAGMYGSHASANANDAARKLEIEMQRMRQQMLRQLTAQERIDREDARRKMADDMEAVVRKAIADQIKQSQS